MIKMSPICNLLNNRSCKEIMDVFVLIDWAHLSALKGYKTDTRKAATC